MRRIKSLVILVLAWGHCYAQTVTSAKAISQKPVFSITLAAPAEPIHLGTPINLTVTINNVTTKEIYWEADRGKNSVYKAVNISLVKGGHEPETTLLNRRIHGKQRADDPVDAGSGSSIVLSYPPGKMFTMTIDVTKLYQITEPGQYTVEASRYDDDSKTIVRSNFITLDVVP
jgi:hypothetical protein